MSTLSDDELRALATEVRRVVGDGNPRQRTALLQAYVKEIGVISG